LAAVIERHPKVQRGRGEGRRHLMLKMVVAIGCAYSLVIKKLERQSNTLEEEEHRGEAL